jgi:hypothetical protein
MGGDLLPASSRNPQQGKAPPAVGLFRRASIARSTSAGVNRMLLGTTDSAPAKNRRSRRAWHALGALARLPIAPCILGIRVQASGPGPGRAPMQTRGPGTFVEGDRPLRTGPPGPVQTGAAMTSLSQLGSQHRRVVGGGASQGALERRGECRTDTPSLTRCRSVRPVVRRSSCARGLHGSRALTALKRGRCVAGLLQLVPAACEADRHRHPGRPASRAPGVHRASPDGPKRPCAGFSVPRAG